MFAYIEVVSIDGELTDMYNNNSIKIDNIEMEGTLKYETLRMIRKIEKMLKGIEHRIAVLNHPYGGPNEMGIRIWIPTFNEHAYICLYK